MTQQELKLLFQSGEQCMGYIEYNPKDIEEFKGDESVEDFLLKRVLAQYGIVSVDAIQIIKQENKPAAIWRKSNPGLWDYKLLFKKK